MGDAITKRSCAFCTSSERAIYEEALLNGDMSPKQMDKEMGWRANTADRHFRNHMGEYHMASNHTCKICTNPSRAEIESMYFSDGSLSQEIAEYFVTSHEISFSTFSSTICGYRSSDTSWTRNGYTKE